MRKALVTSSMLFGLMLTASIVLLCSTLVAQAGVGTVTKTQGTTSPGQGGSVNMGDRLTTGKGARMAVTFSDGSTMTLGENATVVVDKFVYDPNKSSATVALSVSKGALQFAGGKIEKMKKKDVTVKTSYAALAVRGTHFWTGKVDGKHGVLLLNGRVDVKSKQGKVVLNKPNYGVDIETPRKRRH